MHTKTAKAAESKLAVKAARLSATELRKLPKKDRERIMNEQFNAAPEYYANCRKAVIAASQIPRQG